jgi:hypothetical protein
VALAFRIIVIAHPKKRCFATFEGGPRVLGGDKSRGSLEIVRTR